MQVSAQSRSQLSGGKYRSHGSETVTSVDAAGDQPVGRGGRPSGPDQDEPPAVPDPRTEKTGHKTVFLARSLSSTLTELQLSSGASGGFAKVDRFDSAVSGQTVSLDDLLSSFLSAA